MTAKALQAQLSRIELDGIIKALPAAVQSAMKPGPLFVLNSGLLDLVNTVSAQAPFYWPFKAVVLGVYSRVRTQLGTGAGVAAFGILGSLTKFASQSVPISAVAGTEHVWTLASAANLIINPGDVSVFSGDGGATSTGDVDVTAFVQPYIP